MGKQRGQKGAGETAGVAAATSDGTTGAGGGKKTRTARYLVALTDPETTTTRIVGDESTFQRACQAMTNYSMANPDAGGSVCVYRAKPVLRLR